MPILQSPSRRGHVPAGGTSGQVITKLSNDNWDYNWANATGGGGGGTVTSFSSGNLSPLFTTSVGTPTLTPALTFSLSNAAAHTFLGNNTGSIGAPNYVQPAISDLSNLSGTSKLLGSGSAGTAISEITLGTNLSMSGTTLNATGGGSLAWYNVKTYGAIGDGVTNDTTAIQSALAAIPAGGGVLYFPAGQYLYAGTTLTLDRSITVRGDGGYCAFAQGADHPPISTILLNSTTVSLFTVTANGCMFKDIGLKNTSVTTPSAGAGIVVPSGGWRSHFENITIDGFYINLDIQSGGAISIEGSMFIGPVLYGIKLRFVTIPDGGDQFISNSYLLCDYNRTPTSAIRIESGGGTKISNTKINAYQGLWTYGIDLAVGDNVNTADLLVSNCSIEGYSDTGMKGRTGTVSSTWVNILLTGNQFMAFGTGAARGIDLRSTTAGDFTRVTITGNVMQSIGGSVNPAIYLDGTGQIVLNGNSQANFVYLTGIGANVTYAFANTPSSVGHLFSTAGEITNATTDGATVNLTSPIVQTAIADTNANPLIGLLPTGGGLNHLTVGNATLGTNPFIGADGGTNVDISIQPKGNGNLELKTNPGSPGRTEILINNTNGTSTSGLISFRSNGTEKWALGNDTSAAGAFDFFLLDSVNSLWKLWINGTTKQTAVPSDAIFGFSSSNTFPPSALDTGLTRLSAGAMALGNGSAGDFSGTLKTTIVNAATGFQVAGAAASGKILIGNGTNFVASTPTYPNASATAGKVLVSDGTNFVASTPTYPNASTTSGYQIKSDGTNYVSYPSDIINSSTAAVSAGYAADTYLAGSSCVVAAGDFKAKGQYHCVFDMAKTAAGTAAPVINVRVGTAGTTSDAAVLTFTLGAGTAATDTAVFELFVTFRSVGSGTSAVVHGMLTVFHTAASAAGITSTADKSLTPFTLTTSSGFNSSTATTIGVSFNGGASFSGTNTIVQAQLTQP